jgi:hypothetical protein
MLNISQKSDDAWRFRCYDTASDRKGFHGWYDLQNARTRAEIDAVLEILACQTEWSADVFKELRGACRGISEIRVSYAVDPYDDSDEPEMECFRLLGFVWLGRREFVLLRGFRKENGSEYSKECPKAHWSKAAVLKDQKRAPSCEF